MNLLHIPLRSEEQWCYNQKSPTGPSNWKNLHCCKYYNPSMQSPIVINALDSKFVEKPPKFYFFGLTNQPHRIELTNTGKYFQMNFSYLESTPFITGGPLCASYKFFSVTFHYTDSDQNGCEHKINGITYGMEMHLTFINSKYKDWRDATHHFDGVAIIAIFFEISRFPAGRTEYPFIRYLKNIVAPYSRYRLDAIMQRNSLFTLHDIIGESVKNFYCYYGSLTHPPCTACVCWIVSTQPLLISKGEMIELRKIKGCDGRPMNNCRPPHPLGDRTLHYFAYPLEKLSSKIKNVDCNEE